MSRAPVVPRQREKRGFTLVEIMVAIIVLSIGLLGLASTSAVVTRQIGGGAQMTLAASTAQARFEILRSMDCTLLSSGSASARGISEVWTVTALTRAREVTDTVKFTTPRGQSVHAYRTMIPCVP